MTKSTHTGTLVGGIITKRPIGKVQLCEKKNCWVDVRTNIRYSKKDGYDLDNDWGLSRLDLSTIEKLT